MYNLGVAFQGAHKRGWLMDLLWLLRPAQDLVSRLWRWRRRGWASKVNISAQLDLSTGKWRCCYLQIMNNNAEFEVHITSIKSRHPTGMLLAPSDNQSTMIPVEAKAATNLEVSWVLPRKGRVRPGFERPMLRIICIAKADRKGGYGNCSSGKLTQRQADPAEIS